MRLEAGRQATVLIFYTFLACVRAARSLSPPLVAAVSNLEAHVFWQGRVGSLWGTIPRDSSPAVWLLTPV